ncbi:MAG: type II secretion system F family protein [Deltaproteobacteria bacterium]|nr:type II secretion system F family protein [Deltaproteobacteria bacterium]
MLSFENLPIFILVIATGCLILLRLKRNGLGVQNASKILNSEVKSSGKSEDKQKAFNEEKTTRQFLRKPYIFFALVGLVLLAFGLTFIALALLGFAYLCWRIWENSERSKLTDRIVFEELPLELENLIMTVESGNDIVQGLKKVSSADFGETFVKKIFRELIDKLTAGLDFATAVEIVKKKYNHPKLVFVLNYIKISVQEGGEVVDQLEELADTVTASYENYIDKEVNKMPAKALIPVMFILAGMLTIYLAEPLSYMAKELPKIQENLEVPGNDVP